MRRTVNHSSTVKMRMLFLLTILPMVVYVSEANYIGHRLVSVQAQTREQLDFLASVETSREYEGLDFWTEPSLLRATDIRVPPRDFGKLRAALAQAGMSVNVKYENLQQVVDEASERSSKIRASKAKSLSSGCNHLEIYCNLDEINEILSTLANKYHGRVSVESIGNSSEGRPIQRVKIVETAGGAPKDAVWVEGGAHAREWIGVASAVNLVDQLAKNPDAKTNLMLQRYDWYIVVVLNPDGYSYTHQSSNNRYWRKNRQRTCYWDYGTDLNRNFDVAWGTTGVDHFCMSDIFPGPGAFSAPESSALRDAVSSTPNVLAFFSVHAYSQFMLVPYAYTNTKPGRYNDLMGVAIDMMGALAKVNGTEFLVGTPPELLYEASGGSYDYMYLEQGIPWSYCYELRPEMTGSSGLAGFNLAEEYIPVAVDEMFMSLWAFADLNPGWPAGW